MKTGLRVKITLAFFLVTFLLFAIVSVLANFFLERQFKEYVISKQEQKNGEIVSLIASRYKDWGNKWNAVGIENIGVDALGEALILRIHAADGTVIWDAQVHNNGMCTAILQHIAQNMQAHNPNFQGGYVEKSYPVVSDGKKVGSVDVGYYGPYFYSDIDIQFLGTLNNLLLLGAVVSAIACFIFGWYMARRLTRPIARVIDAAGRIARGDFSEKVHETSGTREITALTESINSLADKLREQELLRQRLTADVAHELRTPLATLQSHLEAMIDGIWDADRERLISCHEETRRLSALVGDLEQLTQFESENLTLHKEQIGIYGLLKRITTNFEGAFQNKNVGLSLEGGGAVHRSG